MLHCKQIFHNPADGRWASATTAGAVRGAGRRLHTQMSLGSADPPGRRPWGPVVPRRPQWRSWSPGCSVRGWAAAGQGLERAGDLLGGGLGVGEGVVVHLVAQPGDAEVGAGGGPRELSGLEDDAGGEVTERVDVGAGEQVVEELAGLCFGSVPLSGQARPQETAWRADRAHPTSTATGGAHGESDDDHEDDEGGGGHRDTSWVASGADGSSAGWGGAARRVRSSAVWARRRWSCCSRLPARSGPRGRGSLVRFQRSR